MRTTENSIKKRERLCGQLAVIMKEQNKTYLEVSNVTELKVPNLNRIALGKYSTSVDLLLQFGEALGYELTWKKIV